MIKLNLIKKLCIGGVALSSALVVSTQANAYYSNDDIGYYYGVGDYGLNDIYDYSLIGQYQNIAWSRNSNYLLKQSLNQNNDAVINYCLGNASRWFDSGSIINYNTDMFIDNNNNPFSLRFFSYAYDTNLFNDYQNITKYSEADNLNTLYLYTPDNSCFSYEHFGVFTFVGSHTNDIPSSLILQFDFDYSNIDIDDFNYVSGNTTTLNFSDINKYVLILSCENTYYDFVINNDSSRNLINYNISPLSCGFLPIYSYWDCAMFTNENSNLDGIYTNLTSWTVFTLEDSTDSQTYNNHYATYVKNNRESALTQENLNTINNLNSQIQSLSNQINDLNNSNSNLVNQVNTLTLSRDSLITQLASYNNMTYDQIYQLGYNNGQSSVSTTNATIMGLFGSIANVPITILNGVVGPTLLGVPIISILLTFLSILLILWMIKKFIK